MLLLVKESQQIVYKYNDNNGFLHYHLAGLLTINYLHLVEGMPQGIIV